MSLPHILKPVSASQLNLWCKAAESIRQAIERLTVSLNKAGEDYQVTQETLKPIRSRIWATVIKLIPTAPPGITILELRRAWLATGQVPNQVPSENTICSTMVRCADKAGVHRSAGKPARWWAPT